MNTKTNESNLIIQEGYRTRSDEASMPAVQSTAVTPMDMLKMAVSQGADLEKLEKLMALQERWEANEAKKSFVAAMAEFKASSLVITKDKTNTQFSSKYSSIGNLVNTANESLSKFGLSARWDIDQANGIKVTCILTHRMGHSEQCSMTGPADTSGKKNPLQEIKSTITYLKISTFEAITGIASSEGNADDDGNGADSGGKMNEGELCDYLAAIEAATSKKDIQKAYMPALIAASECGDQGAQNRLNAAKNAAIAKVKE